MLRILWVILLLCLGASQAVADTSSQRETLRGIRSVDVVIETLSAAAERAGLSRSTIQTEVELRLRQAGLLIVPSADVTDVGRPFVYVNVTLVSGASNVYAYTIDVELNQFVSLARDMAVRVMATTWSAHATGIVGSKHSETVREGVRETLDRFLNAYLAVNPKR